jgi:hypothetical protein
VSFIPYASNSVYFLGVLGNGEVIVINSQTNAIVAQQATDSEAIKIIKMKKD